MRSEARSKPRLAAVSSPRLSALSASPVLCYQQPVGEHQRQHQPRHAHALSLRQSGSDLSRGVRRLSLSSAGSPRDEIFAFSCLPRAGRGSFHRSPHRYKISRNILFLLDCQPVQSSLAAPAPLNENKGLAESRYSDARHSSANGRGTRHDGSWNSRGTSGRLAPSRRGLITGLAALIAAPALVRASSIMPVKAAAAPAVDPIASVWMMGGYLVFTTGASVLYASEYAEPFALPPHQSALTSEGKPPEVSAWKGAAGPALSCAPAPVSFPACSPAVVQSHQRALPMSGEVL
jgi:hypothetical protein